MKFDPARLSFSQKLPGRDGRKAALEYRYDGQSFLVYPQVFPFGGGDREDVTIHYALDNAALSALMDDGEWLAGALEFLERDYRERLAE